MPGEPDDSAVLVAENLAKTYTTGLWPRRHRQHVLSGASIELRRGEVVGLVGENGSGKSTLMQIVVGSLDRDAGTVERTGTLGYCPQEPVLYQRLTCNEHFELFGEAYGLERFAMEASRSGVYDALGFTHWADSRVEELSGGTRSKLNLGLALLADPDLLLLDEPYAGFDWDTYQRFWEIASSRREEGRALMIISHFIDDEELFDRIYDLRDGTTRQR